MAEIRRGAQVGAHSEAFATDELVSSETGHFRRSNTRDQAQPAINNIGVRRKRAHAVHHEGQRPPVAAQIDDPEYGQTALISSLQQPESKEKQE